MVFSIPTPKVLSFDSWQPPAEGWIKLNFDAHIGAGCRRGLGISCRDDRGQVILTGTRQHQANWSVEASEAMASVYGMEVARRMGYTKVHLEGDALNVISAISNKMKGRAPINLIYDRLLTSSLDFDAVVFSYVGRCGNIVAHMVARWETDNSREKICMAPFPVCLRTLAELDLS